jgi:hypothetical protein
METFNIDLDKSEKKHLSLISLIWEYVNCQAINVDIKKGSELDWGSKGPRFESQCGAQNTILLNGSQGARDAFFKWTYSIFTGVNKLPRSADTYEVYLETGNHIKILRYELDLALSK